MKRLFFFFIAYLLATNSLAAQKMNPLPKDNIIYFLQQDFKKDKVKIGFASKTSGTKTSVLKSVLTNKKNAYLKFATEPYYLNVDSLPGMPNDICNELQKIEIDTTVRYGEPFSRSVSVIFVIDKTGKIETYGIARGVGDSYYEEATLKVLQNYNSNNKMQTCNG